MKEFSARLLTLLFHPFKGKILWGSWYWRGPGNLALHVHWTSISSSQVTRLQALWRHQSTKSVVRVCDRQCTICATTTFGNYFDSTSLLRISLWPCRWNDGNWGNSVLLANADTEAESPRPWFLFFLQLHRFSMWTTNWRWVYWKMIQVISIAVFLIIIVFTLVKPLSN